MAGKGVEEHPIHMAKWVINNLVDGIVDDLMKKNVLTENELRKVEKGVNLVVKNTENLIDNVVEKTKMVHQILVENALNVQQWLSLKSQSDSEDDEPENNESPSSLIESEDEREEQIDEEEAGLAQALPSPPAAPQEIQAAQPECNVKLCTRDDFDEIRTAMADHIYPVMEQEGRTRLALIICNKEFKALEEMEAVLWEFAARQEHRSSDSTFLVFMTHGILDGICGTKHTDDEPDILRDETIFQIFNNRTGTTWVPDMGEVSLCRCDHTRQCYIRADAVRKDHVEKDFVAFKSSTPNNISWINESHGSIFIQRLIDCFKEFACCNHLQEIFRKVQHSFETPNELAQMPTIETVSMTRHFYLFPGI